MANKILSEVVKANAKILKAAGLYSGDLRKMTDKELNNSKSPIRRSIIRLSKKFESVINGDAEVLPVKGREKQAALKSRGYQVAHKANRVIIKKSKKDEQILISKDGHLSFVNTRRDYKSGQIKNEFLFEPNINAHSIKNFNDLIDQYSKINYVHKNNSRIAFTYFGNLSRQSFSSFSEALNKLLTYEQNQNDISESLDPSKASELIKAIQFFEYFDSSSEYGRDRSLILEKKKSFDNMFSPLWKK